MIAAVVPAAGIGTRFAFGDSPQQASNAKQFVELGGKPLFSWALSVICRHPQIDSVIVMLSPQALDAMGDVVKRVIDSPKLTVAQGGATRQESVHRGLEYLDRQDEKPKFVIVHDAVRPFITTKMIDETIEALTRYGACTLGVQLTDTIKKVENGLIRQTLDRSSLYLIQTPQGGRFDWLLDGHRRAAEKQIETTDDAAILELAGHDVSIVSGSPYNLKITRPEDIKIAEALAPLF
jgi:2-C-methyl-D-erythritol 4-phosphate cytidylyltransferase